MIKRDICCVFLLKKYDKQRHIYNIKIITPKHIWLIVNYLQLHYVDMRFFVTVWSFGGHWMQQTLDFKPLLPISEIDVFTYPTLTKSPAGIALPGCDNDNKWTHYLIWLENTRQGGATNSLNKALFGLGLLTIYYIKLQFAVSVCLSVPPPPYFDTTVGPQPNLAHIFG